MSVTELLWWQVNTGSCYDLLPRNTKPLHDPILTNVYVAIWLHLATVCKHIEAWIKWGNRNDIVFCRFDIGYCILRSSLWHVEMNCIMTRPRIGSNQRLSLTITHASRILPLWISTDENHIRIIKIMFLLGRNIFVGTLIVYDHLRHPCNAIELQFLHLMTNAALHIYIYIYMYIHIYHRN